MNASSSLILLGIGTAGAQIVRGVSRSFGESLRYAIIDTDATSGRDGEPFTLLGGNRLSGRGSGGSVVNARLAAEDSIKLIDEHLEDVRIAVIVTALGGGTGSGATIDVLKHLNELGIPSIVFATTPFMFEGDERLRTARGVMTMIEDAANATFFIPLDKLIQGVDEMDEAMRRAIDTLAQGITLFWRLVEKPGYIRLDGERIRHLITNAGRGRFAVVNVQGPTRATDAVDQLIRSELLATAAAPVNAIVCGVLAGNDLRLSEIGQIADGIRETFGNHLQFDLGTVNDERTFCGRISVVVMLFESTRQESAPTIAAGGKKPRKGANPLVPGPAGRGRFNNVEATIWHGEDLDVPTFIRKNISLDF